MTTNVEQLREENAERVEDLVRQGVAVVPWLPLGLKLDLLIERLPILDRQRFDLAYERAYSEVLDQAEEEVVAQQLQVPESTALLLPGMGG